MTSTAPTTRQLMLALLVIILLGTFLRLNASLRTVVEYPLRADAGQYFSYAYNLRHYGVYSQEPRFASPENPQPLRQDAMRPPGYPLALYPFTSEVPTGTTILNITLMQGLLGILMIPLTYLLGRRVLPGFWPLLPALLVAVSPQLVASGTYVLSETLFAFWLLLGLVMLASQLQKPEKLSLAFASGAVLAMAALTRPTLNYFLPFILLGVSPMLSAAYRWRQGLALVAGFALLFAPWPLYNLITLGMASDPTLSISALIHGHYPNFMFNGQPESLGYPYRFDPQIDEITTSVGSALSAILQRFQADPGTYLQWYLLGKPLAFLSWGDVTAGGGFFTYPTPVSPYHGSPLFLVTKTLMSGSHWLWVILAIGGAFALFIPPWRRSQPPEQRIHLQLLVVVTAYFIAIHTVGFPIARYNIPVLPVIYLLAAHSALQLTRWWSNRNTRAQESHG